MYEIIKAEHLKQKRTFARALPVAAPLVNLLLVLILTGGMDKAFAAGAWNWWYAALLPGSLAVQCYLSCAKERKSRYYNLKSLPHAPGKLVLGKVLYLALCLFAANLLTFIGTLAGGAAFGTNISARAALLAAALLSLAYLWEISLYLFLSARFGMTADIITCALLTGVGVAAMADGAYWWLCPSAIPVRLMCPALGILPNGLPVPGGSGLRSSGVILPGLILSAVWFAVCTVLLCRWFERAEVK